MLVASQRASEIQWTRHDTQLADFIGDGFGHIGPVGLILREKGLAAEAPSSLAEPASNLSLQLFAVTSDWDISHVLTQREGR